MTPYREQKLQETTATGNGCRHPDHLEVTRTTSNNSMSSIPDSPTSSRISSAAAVLECDYDANPTVLYQAIEAKQWDYAISLFTNRGNNNKNSSSSSSSNNNHNNNHNHNKLVVEHGEDRDDEEEASATWVVRKEYNGKLRWRLLPLHAAVIFGSPLRLIEYLLADYPQAAQCKDDRGMLPLHLAFRNHASWDVIDELLATYPMAVFVSDRKGRTPLACGVLPQHKNHNQAGSSSNNTVVSAGSISGQSVVGNHGRLPDRTPFRTVAGVIELYSQIVISGERKRVEQETRALAQTSISQLQEAHYRQVEELRKQMEDQETESNQRTEQLEKENQKLQERLRKLEEELAARDQSHVDMTKKLRLTNDRLNLANERAEANAGNPGGKAVHENVTKNKSVDKMLRMMADTMVKQQKAYHGRVQELLTSYQKLVNEREQMRSIFTKDSASQQQKESVMIESFQNWFLEEGKKLSQQERSLVSSASSSSSVGCSTDFNKEETVNKEPVQQAPHDPKVVSSRTTDEITRTTVPTVPEKVRPDKPTPTISAATAATTTISRVPISDGEKLRPQQKEPREAPA